MKTIKTLRKVLVLAVVAALCSVLAVGCSSAATDAGSDKGDSGSAGAAASSDKKQLVVGYYGGTCEMALFTALNYGYLEEEGFDVDTVQIGYSDIATLMADGQLDVYLCTPTDIMSMKSGLPIYFTDSMHTGCFEGVASADSGIETVADLEGKTIAVDMIGSVAYVQICSEMTRLGYDHTKVNWKVYDPSTMIDAMTKGEVDGFCQGDQLTTVAIRDYGAVRFFSDTYDEYLKDTLCCFVGVESSLVDEDPEAAQAISRAIKKSCEKIAQDPEEVVEKAISAGYLAVDDVQMCVDLVSAYTWLAGDEDRYMESFREHLRENYRAGLLDDAPADETEREAYYDEFIAQHGRYSG